VTSALIELPFGLVTYRGNTDKYCVKELVSR